jgi:ABC-type Na+ transport system ATPase subunit NatA
MSAPPPIEVRQVRRRFGGARAAGLDGLTLTVGAGCVLGLVGPNGAGKSTLLGVLATLITPEAGEARVCGHDVVRQPRAVRRLVGFAPDATGAFYARLTTRENLRLFGALHGLDAAAIAARVSALAEGLAFEAWLDAPLQACSAGVRQRVNLARALLHGPRVLLLDEPLQHLDAVSVSAIATAIEQTWAARDTGAAVITAPRVDDLPSVCDEVVQIGSGRTVGVSPAWRDDARARRWGS